MKFSTSSYYFHSLKPNNLEFFKDDVVIRREVLGERKEHNTNATYLQLHTHTVDRKTPKVLFQMTQVFAVARLR